MAVASGTLEFTNPNDSGPVRLRCGAQQDLRICQEDSGGSNVDMLSFEYEAAGAAWMEAMKDFRLNSGVRLRWESADTTTTSASGSFAVPANAEGFVKIEIGSTEYVLPYFSET